MSANNTIGLSGALISNTIDSITAPDLRFDDGDLAVKLGVDSKDWLLLHRDKVRASMPVLGAMLKYEGDARISWTTPKKVMHPTTRRQMEVFTISLKQVEKTFVLSESEEVLLGPEPKSWGSSEYSDFHESELSEGWPNSRNHRFVYSGHRGMDGAMQAHRILFAIIYNYPIFLQALDRYHDFQCTMQDVRHGAMDTALRMISIVGSYAEYYGNLGIVASPLIDALKTHPCIWQAISMCTESYGCHQLQHFLRIAAKFRDKQMYFDALRHLLASASSGHYNIVCEELDISKEDAEEWLDPMFQENKERADEIVARLYRLELSEGFAIYCSERSTPLTTYQNALDYKRVPSEGAREMEKSALLARMIFSQWLTQELYGDKVYYKNTPREKAGGSLAHAISMLETAAAWTNPAGLFGKSKDGKPVALQYVQDFSKGNRFDPKRQIQTQLEKLVHQAVAEIKDVFSTVTTEDDASDEDDNLTLTYRRTEHVDEYSNITYFALDEMDVPWANEQSWEMPMSLESPDVNIRPATGKVLSAMGIDETDAEDEEGVSGLSETIGNDDLIERAVEGDPAGEDSLSNDSIALLGDNTYGETGWDHDTEEQSDL